MSISIYVFQSYLEQKHFFQIPCAVQKKSELRSVHWNFNKMIATQIKQNHCQIII